MIIRFTINIVNFIITIRFIFFLTINFTTNIIINKINMTVPEYWLPCGLACKVVLPKSFSIKDSSWLNYYTKQTFHSSTLVPVECLIYSCYSVYGTIENNPEICFTEKLT